MFRLRPAPAGKSKRDQSAARRRHFRPTLEWLEDRWLPSSSSVAASYLQTPLSFVANKGQTDASVDYLSEGSGYTLFLTAQGAVLSLQQSTLGNAGAQSAVISMQLVGANATPVVSGVDELPGKSNYFVGNDPSDWQTNVPNYGQVSYQNLYPGIDGVFYGTQRQLEYNFTVAPGANPGVIKLGFQGQTSMSLDAQGNLVLQTTGGDVVEDAPVVYQEISGVRQSVTGKWVIENGGQVGFAIGAYNTTQPLTIDPLLSYSSYLGGTGADVATAVAVDSTGNVYLVGETASTDFPQDNQKPPLTSRNNGLQAFVTEINGPKGTAYAAGSEVLFSTYYGGAGPNGNPAINVATSIAIDADKEIVVGGYTNSMSLPAGAAGFTTPPYWGAASFQEYNGGTGTQPQDGFVFKLEAGGASLNFSTYLGGIGADQVNGVAVNSDGDIYVTGTTYSSDFPVISHNAHQPVIGGQADAFLFMLSDDGERDEYSTFLGGSGNDFGTAIAVDAAGNAYIAGQTASANFPTVFPIQSTLNGATEGFLTKIYESSGGTGSTDDGQLAYSTYLGGPGTNAVTSIALDSSNDVYLTGYTTSADFPTAGSPFQASFQGTPGKTDDAFVTEVNSVGTDLVYSTYLGGASTGVGSIGNGIVVDGSGDAIVIGTTDSPAFPTLYPIQRGEFSTADNVFVSKLLPGGSALDYSTYLGGAYGNNSDLVTGTSQGLGIAYSPVTPDEVYIVGETNSYVAGEPFANSFPTYAPSAGLGGPFIQSKYGGGTDAFVAAISDTDKIVSINGSVDTLQVQEGTPTMDITITGVISSGGIITVNGAGVVTDTYIGGLGEYIVAQIPATDLASPGDYLVNFVEGAAGISNQLVIEVTPAPLMDESTAVTYKTTQNILNNNLLVATFADADPNASVADFAGSTVNWGDGTAATSALIVAAGSNDFGSVFKVYGSHVYANPTTNGPPYAVTTTIQEAGSSTPLVSNLTSVIVADAPMTDVTPTEHYTATVGFTTPTVLVGEFQDGDTKDVVGDFQTPQVNWGDNTSSLGTISATQTPGVFEITSSHLYTSTGDFPVSVKVTDVYGSTVTTGNVTVNVVPATLNNTTQQTAWSSVVGLDTQPLIMGTFSDVDPTATTTDFSGATVNWGDGTVSSAQITAAGSSGSGATLFDVYTHHAYQAKGVYNVVITVNETGGLQLEIPLTDSAYLPSGENLGGVEGTPLNGVVATFQDPSQNLTASSFPAVISWGDGQTSVATVVSNGQGGYNIEGNHTYEQAGAFAIVTTIYGGTTGTSVNVNGVANIVAPPLQAQGETFSATARSAVSTTVATFNDGGVANPVGDFTATIAWGDGGTSTGTITATGVGTYAVTGTHTYALANTYEVSVTINGGPGNTAIGSGTAYVAAATSGGGGGGGGSTTATPGSGELTAVTSGSTSTVFTITPTNMLYRYTAASGWSALGANIIQISASSQTNGLAVLFAVTSDHALFRFDNANGWQELGAPGTVSSVSAGTDSNGNADAFVITMDGTFTEYRGSSGWITSALGGKGSILSMSAATADRVVVVTAGHALAEFDPHFGWFMLTGNGFAQTVSAVTDAQGLVDVFAQTLNQALYVYQPLSGWAPIGGAGSIADISAGTDKSGRPVVFVITTNGGLLEYRTASGWSQFFPPATNATELSATAVDRVFMTFGNGSLYGEDPTLGISDIAPAGFAHI